MNLENIKPIEKPIKSKDIPEFASNSELRTMLEKNLELNEEILRKVKYIKGYIRFQKLFGWVKLALIIVPLIAAYFYLPPLINQVMNIYTGATNDIKKIQSVTDQVQNINNSGSIPGLNINDLQKLLTK